MSLTTRFDANYIGDMKPLSPHSRPDALAKRDGRTREARLLKRVYSDLISHVGGTPSATQLALIEQVAQIRIRLAAFDRRYAETGTMTEHDSRTYLAWANTHARIMARLGLKPAGGTEKDRSDPFADFLPDFGGDDEPAARRRGRPRVAEHVDG
jgi:hypothetical protein